MKIGAFIYLGLYLLVVATTLPPFHKPTTRKASLSTGLTVAAGEIPAASKQQIQAACARLPLRFEANQGQTDDQVRFLSRAGGYTLFLTSTEAVLELRALDRQLRNSEYGMRNEEAGIGFRQSRRQDYDDLQSPTHSVYSTTRNQQNPRSAIRNLQWPQSAVLHVKLVGTNPAAEIFGLDELPGKSHYLVGNDPKQWRTNVPAYTRVKYRDVYRGIDLVYYGKQGQLEYDWVLGPGADPKTIAFGFQGADKIEIDTGGDLVLHTPSGQIRQHRPLVYQERDGVRQEIPGGYVLQGRHQVGFQVAAYDTRKPLVIDPVLSYFTYLGGGADDNGYAIAVDAADNAYVTGSTLSVDFPTEAGALQSASGGQDAFVTKLNAAGSALVYSTYLGGSGNDEGLGIAVDFSGNAYVTGVTSSTDIPAVGTLQPVFGGGNTDAFLAKLDSSGSALVYSSFLGGSGAENVEDYHLVTAIAVDSSGAAYVIGITSSTNFPTVNPLQAANRGRRDTFVAKINAAGSALLYSTYLGGSKDDDGRSIAVDSSGNAYLTGETSSTDFPLLTPLQAYYGGGPTDVFVAKLNAAGALIYSTYLGGGGTDGSHGIAVDSSGNAYLTGHTDSVDFPLMDPFRRENGGSYDGFVTKVNASGSALVYSTYIGGNRNDETNPVAVDSSGNAYVTGHSESDDFPTMSPFQAANRGIGDTFVAKFTPAGALVYSTFLGGSDFEHGYGIAVDSSGNAYVTGETRSRNFATSTLQPALAGGLEAYVAKISDSATATPDLSINKSHSGNFTVGTNGVYTITVRNAGSAASSETITVADNLPTGLSFVTGAGTGWTCAASGQTVTCTNAGPIAAGGSSTITLTVGVAAAAVGSVTNSVTVSNFSDSHSANNTASDPTTVSNATTITAALTLTVRETAGIARSGEVLRSGVPLPRSLNLRSTGALTLVDTGGIPVPAEFEVLARWDAGRSADAPIQWLLVTFPATVAANGSIAYGVVTDGSAGPNPAPAVAVSVTQTGNQVTVNTGAATFSLGSGSGALFDQVRLAGGTVLVSGSALTARVNNTDTAHPTARRIAIEHAGPLTAILVVEGAYDLASVGGGGLGSRRRYVFTASSPTAIVRHVVNWEGDRCGLDIDRCGGSPNALRVQRVRDALTLDLTSPLAVTAVGDFQEPAVQGSVPAGQSAWVQQRLRARRTDPLAFEVNVGGTRASGKQASGGMLAVSGSPGAVAVALNHMHRYEPQALRLLADGRLAVDLADDQAWLGNHQGLFATLAVSALAANPSRLDLDRLVWAPLNRPLRAWPQAAWFAASDAVDEIPVGTLPADLTAYDSLVPSVLSKTVQKTDELGLAGLMTFGVYPRFWGNPLYTDEVDCNNDPTDPAESWDNLYWCTTWTDYHNTIATAPIWAMRSGQVEWLDEIGFPGALRTLHTQIIQCAPGDPFNRCGQGPTGYGGYRVDFNSSHQYWDNLFLYYWLTGDYTVVETLKRGASSMRNFLCSRRPGAACLPDDPPTDPYAGLEGRVASQWFAAFRFVGLAGDDASYLDDWRSGLAREVTQWYVETEQSGRRYGFLIGGPPLTGPGSYSSDQLWIASLYDMNNLFRLQRDTGDAPIGNPAIPPSQVLAAWARTLVRFGATLSGNGTATGNWPNSLNFTWAGLRIGGTLTSVTPNTAGGDPFLYGTGKATLAALLVRAGQQSGNASLTQMGADLTRLTLTASQANNSPLGKEQGEYLARLHAAVARLTTPAPSTVCLGDINGDKVRDVFDVVRILNHIVGKSPLADEALARADINQDGRVDVLDVVLLLNHIVGRNPLPNCV